MFFFVWFFLMYANSLRVGAYPEGIEPKGIDFVIEPTVQTKDDREYISQIIAHYKAAGEILSVPISNAKNTNSKKGIITKSQHKL